MWTKQFWIDVFERAVKTFAQAVVAAIGANATGMLDVDFAAVLGIAALTTVASVLTSIASAPASTKGTASLTNNVTYVEK